MADTLSLRDLQKVAIYADSDDDGVFEQVTSFGGGVGGGSGTEYTEGATDASITGTAILWEDAADTLRPVSAAKPLPVDVVTASVTVDGTVEIGATSLAALETVELGATTLAALESVTVVDGGSSLTVDGTVELGATTLAALETITVGDGGSTISVDDGGGVLTVDGTVELGATTLAALESITVVDGGSSISVDDNGSSLTVDGTVTANIGTPSGASSATVTADTSVTTTEENIASNSARRGMIVTAPKTNTDDCYIKFGSTVSSTSYTACICPGDYWEMPENVYTGAVYYESASGTQTLMITEW